MSLRLTAICVLGVLLLALAGGCNQDQGEIVKYDPEKSKQQDAKSIEAIKNNPKIPENQKQAIIARMQGRGAVR